MALLRNPIASTALASATSAQDAARNGATIVLNALQPGCLVAHLTVTIVTGSVVATGKWQGSADNSTFVDVAQPENPANVTITATATRALVAPPGIFGFPYARFVVTLSGASTAAGDLTAVTYRYLSFQPL